MGSSIDYVKDNDYFFSGFDASNFSGDNVYNIFENQDVIITEDSNVQVDTNKNIWERGFVEIPYSDFPQDFNDLKLMWVNQKKEDRILIENCSS